jgi:hypothetical protein
MRGFSLKEIAAKAARKKRGEEIFAASPPKEGILRQFFCFFRSLPVGFYPVSVSFFSNFGAVFAQF